MEKMIHESLQTPVLGEYDVIVCGGGVAGLAAAVAARRHGATVLLLEKAVVLGGLATHGLISWYEPLCNGRGRRVMNGMAYEMLRLAIRDSYDSLAEEWKKDHLSANAPRRYATHYSYSMFAMALDEWLLDSGAKLLLDTAVVAPVMNGSRIEGVIVENKSGRGCYLAKTVVDATGDADVALRTGIPCEDGVNYLTYIGYYTSREYAARAAESGNMLHNYRWMNSGSDLWGKGHPEDMPFFIGIDAQSQTDFVLEGRKRLYEKLKSEPAQQRDITVLPGMAQYRKSRRVIGEYTLEESRANTHFETSVGALPDFAHPGVLYEIPYEILYSRRVENLFAAGRNVSSTGWAWDVTRVIPGAVATGQAAGTAAALCVQKGVSNAALPVNELQQALEGDGVWLRFPEDGEKTDEYRYGF